MKRVAWIWGGLALALATGCPPDETDSDGGTDPGGDSSGDGSNGDGNGGPNDPCATVRCAAGTHCEAVEVQCVTAPCPPVAECVPDAGCELIDCLPDYTCVEDENGAGSCVPVGGGVSCGKNTCAEGEVCCNASCGICTPPDGACIQIACEDEEPACDLPCEPGTHCVSNHVCGSDADPSSTKAGFAACPLVEECVPDEECTGPIIDCAAPPPGCNYEGGGCVKGQWTCGTLVCGELCGDIGCEPGTHCEDVCAGSASDAAIARPIPCESTPVCVPDEECTGPLPPCAAPPPGCDYQGGGCVKGQWTCGTLVCGEACGDVTCEQGQHCDYSCAEAAQKPGLVAPIPVPCQPVCVNDDPCAALDCASCKVVDGKAQCGTPCGDNTCFNGQECCNASCGWCVDPGMSCIQIACDPAQ